MCSCKLQVRRKFIVFYIVSLCLTFWGPKIFSYVVHMDLQVELYCVCREVIVCEFVAGVSFDGTCHEACSIDAKEGVSKHH